MKLLQRSHDSTWNAKNKNKKYRTRSKISTRDKSGLTQDWTSSMDIYIDTAFACGWSEELGTNPDSVKSRTGYIIEVMGCPVLWVAWLQPSVATSTMELEYTALYYAISPIESLHFKPLYTKTIKELSYLRILNQVGTLLVLSSMQSNFTGFNLGWNLRQYKSYFAPLICKRLSF